jgi:AcrR family transcriptional regulator
MEVMEVLVPQIRPPAAADPTGLAGRAPGRRERKKQRTRDALIAAALELFAAKGYEHTAVREITDAVDVAERTFFRYFASKEDLALSFVRDGLTSFAQALAARPAEEEPLTAARHAWHAELRRLASTSSYLPVMELIESTPALLAAYLRYIRDHEDEIIQVLAQREGVDPAADPRPRLLAAVIGALVSLASKDGRGRGHQDAEAIAAAFDAYARQLIPALSGHWTDPKTGPGAPPPGKRT